VYLLGSEMQFREVWRDVQRVPLLRMAVVVASGAEVSGGSEGLALLFAGVDDVPDGQAAVVGNEEGAVTGYGDADGTAPDVAIG